MKRVLVIEDDENNRRLITLILEKHGYRVFMAETGIKGMEMAKKERPDFIILDIQLPDIDGFELIKQIRQSDKLKHIPVIAMTSYAMAGDRERILSAGFNGYIEKPIDPFTIMDEIKTILEEKRDEDSHSR
jgi:CheY-like chemotaxis protein